MINDLFLWLNSYVNKPKFYGVYHLSWIIGLIILCIIYTFISKTKIKNKEKLYKITILICWILLLTLETIKQFAMSFNYIDGKGLFIYNYLYFPYQLCSLPFYILPFIIFSKNDKFKFYFVIPTITYVFLGGLLFILIPGSLCNNLYINFHTFAHHGLQIFSSFICFLWYKDKLTIKDFIKIIPILLVTFGLAIILNIFLFKTTGIGIQLWNLSPYVILDMEILENIKQNIGYIPYVVIYFITLLILSFIVYIIPILKKSKLKKIIK